MRKHFTTGLALLLPLVLTALIVIFIVNFLTQPLYHLVENWIIEWSKYHPAFVSITHPTALIIISKVLILLFLITMIFIFGIFGRMLFMRTAFGFGDYLLHRVPFFNKLYKASQDVIHHLLSDSSKAFSQVVLVPFPHANSLSVGLVVCHAIKVHKERDEMDLIPVFIPGTPNPSVGFLLMFSSNQLIELNMKVDEAMKFIVSCAVVMPPFSIVAKSPKSSIESPV